MNENTEIKSVKPRVEVKKATILSPNKNSDGSEKPTIKSKDGDR